MYNLGGNVPNNSKADIYALIDILSMMNTGEMGPQLTFGHEEIPQHESKLWTRGAP